MHMPVARRQKKRSRQVAITYSNNNPVKPAITHHRLGYMVLVAASVIDATTVVGYYKAPHT